MRAGVLALALIVAATGFAIAEPAKTSKERLSDKASDEQRVDNCHVPPERRGAVVRPDCPEKKPGPTAATGSGSPPR